MSWLEEQDEDSLASDNPQDEENDELEGLSNVAYTAGKDALYQGDHGELRLDARRAFVQLLAGPSLEARRQAKLWSALLRDEAIMRARLSDLFLELVIDRDHQVAFTRQADTGELKVPLLLRRSPLTFLDSILLLLLRQRLAQAETHGDRAVVSIDEILMDLAVYEQAGNTDHAGFINRAKASVEKFKKRSILQKIRASEDRFEISPTLRLLFSADRVEALKKLYEQMTSVEASTTETSRMTESWPLENSEDA